MAVVVAPGTYVIAVSGGVDSVSLLHMLQAQPDLNLIVAHFDHGIRTDSQDDARLVEQLAIEYNLPFETVREELGTGASEELARTRRYAFLRGLAKKHGGQIMTAHHAGDVVETVAINLHRGTGWRGLAVLDSDIVRPLVDMNKSELLAYATNHELRWHEDSTNQNEAYLRNRLRRQLLTLDEDDKRQLLALHAAQKDIKRQIDHELRLLLGDGPTYSRYFFTQLDETVGLEAVRFITAGKLTRPQQRAALLAIKTMKAGNTYQAGSSVEITFTTRILTVKLVK
jgi:tRNA(Ile)-lysidine synthase